MILGKKHKLAIASWMEHSGLSKRAAAHKLDIAPSAFLRWVGQKDINIHEAKWKILEAHIRDHLDPIEEENKIPTDCVNAYKILKKLSGNKDLVAVAEAQLKALTQLQY